MKDERQALADPVTKDLSGAHSLQGKMGRTCCSQSTLSTFFNCFWRQTCTEGLKLFILLFIYLVIHLVIHLFKGCTRNAIMILCGEVLPSCLWVFISQVLVNGRILLNSFSGEPHCWDFLPHFRIWDKWTERWTLCWGLNVILLFLELHQESTLFSLVGGCGWWFM